MEEQQDDLTPELDKYEESQKTEAKLSPRQEIFCQKYIIDFNATKAAIRAGYSKRSAQQQSSDLMLKPVIQKRIQELTEQAAIANQASKDFVIRRLIELADLDLAEAYDDNGRLKPIKDIPPHVRRAIAGVETFEEYEGVGKDREYIGETVKVKLVDKARALEMLGRHLKLFTDKVEHSNPDGKFAPLAIITMPSNGRDKPEAE